MSFAGFHGAVRWNRLSFSSKANAVGVRICTWHCGETFYDASRFRACSVASTLWHPTCIIDLVKTSHKTLI
jgi:hypothetical protein